MPNIKCPLCNENQGIVLYGLTKDMASGKASLVCDTGYAFCNCHNIFYTDKKNLRYDIYGDDYANKYIGCDSLYEPYFKYIDKVNGGLFVEVGSVNDVILDYAVKQGYKNTLCLDICNRNTKHDQKTIDFEKIDTLENKLSIDYLFMAHVFEHFTSPKDTAIKIGNVLNKGGKLFIAMPDPAQINWENPYMWQHLWVHEHYILWDMDSFIKFMELHANVKCVYKERNFFTGCITTGDYRLVFEKL